MVLLLTITIDLWNSLLIDCFCLLNDLQIISLTGQVNFTPN